LVALDAGILRTLVLTLDYPHRVSYYDDWSDAFTTSPHFSCAVDNVLVLKPADLARDIEDYDAVIMLHSCNSDTLDLLEPIVPVLAQRRRAKLLSFVGNEFNSPYVSTVLRNRMLCEARVDIIATQLLREAGEFLYQNTGARVISVPHALNPMAFRPGPEHSTRRLDIGVKGYRYPPFLGDDDRNRLIDHFKANAGRLGLQVDISEDQRIARNGWAGFLGDCRGTISTEVGSWFLEPDDALVTRIYEHLKASRKGLVIKNDSFARRAARRLPMSVKAALWKLLKLGVVKFEILDDFNTTFAELDDLFFKNATRAPIYGKAISSRHFDAIGTKTCQLLLRGRYGDILDADRHYIAIDPDFGNVEDAVRRFKDRVQRQAIVDRAYDHVMSGHTYAHRTRTVFDEFGRL
jgi:spore maturation protein CgeB